MTFRVSARSAEHVRGFMAEVGAFLTGRRTFEAAHGWEGQHPLDVPAFVLTHEIPDGWPQPGSTVQFVTDGIESAVARAKSTAGPKAVAAVLLGAGVRLFDHLADTPAVLGNPTVVNGVGVTHLRYPVNA